MPPSWAKNGAEIGPDGLWDPMDSHGAPLNQVCIEFALIFDRFWVDFGLIFDRFLVDFLLLVGCILCIYSITQKILLYVGSLLS